MSGTVTGRHSSATDTKDTAVQDNADEEQDADADSLSGNSLRTMPVLVCILLALLSV